MNRSTMTRVTRVVCALALFISEACTAGTADPAEPLDSKVARDRPEADSSAGGAGKEAGKGSEREPALNRWVTERPEWLGTRVLPKRPDGFGEVRPTPPLLRDRRFATIDLLPPPKERGFRAEVGPVPSEALRRSSWRPKCPVSADELVYITMPFRGFDHRRHTGELIVNASVADDVVSVFEALYKARFRIEEMRIVRQWEHNAPPTGDSNVTSSFECRQVTLGSTWSQHAYGLAIDINPFHNPYVRGDIVAPELASAYVDRTNVRDGMIIEGDVVTQAFDSIGWEWGGRWNTLKDYMHFSATGH